MFILFLIFLWFWGVVMVMMERCLFILMGVIFMVEKVENDFLKIEIVGVVNIILVMGDVSVRDVIVEICYRGFKIWYLFI